MTGLTEKNFMKIIEVFEVGSIMESDEKSSKIKVLNGDDCQIVSKALNKNKIILHLKRKTDDSEGNVFVRLNEAHLKDFATSKKLLASKNVVGLTLNEFKEFEVEKL
jgi:hypothetical protein